MYIQIVAVEPHLEADELEERPTTFEQNFNLRRFRYETPFTKDGRAQGDFHEQWKRRSILTTEAAFPHVRKRLRVVDTQEDDFSPIENAIEMLERKVAALKAELGSASPQPKHLQMQLQGSLLTQVNVGPLAICATFLDAKVRAKYDAKLTDRCVWRCCASWRSLVALTSLLRTPLACTNRRAIWSARSASASR